MFIFIIRLRSIIIIKLQVRNVIKADTMNEMMKLAENAKVLLLILHCYVYVAQFNFDILFL